MNGKLETWRRQASPWSTIFELLLGSRLETKPPSIHFCCPDCFLLGSMWDFSSAGGGKKAISLSEEHLEERDLELEVCDDRELDFIDFEL